MRKLTAVRFIEAAFAVGLAACDDGSLLERSCEGRVVSNCLPFEYSIVEEATVTPSELEVGHPTAEAMISIRLANCGANTPEPHIVRLIARTTNPTSLADGGSDESLVSLGVELRDNGEDGDATAKDGVIEATVTNPFFNDVPPETDLFVRFEPRAPAQCEDGECHGGTCIGETLEIPYRTGPEYVPPTP